MILEAGESVLRGRMEARGYPPEKTMENIGAQISGAIYSEALERLPARRIHIVSTDSMGPEEAASMVEGIMKDPRKR